MNIKRNISFFLSGFLLILFPAAFTLRQTPANNEILSYTVDPKKQELKLYWKNDKGTILNSIGNLKTYMESKGSTLLFAMNGGMYKEDRSPQGLYIQEQKELSPMDRGKGGGGNFYLQPNGVFYITKGKEPVVCKSSDFKSSPAIQYATQSGPMLIIDGELHPAFTKGSGNLNIRNGVGILPGGKVVFAMSKFPINFYDFATFFKNLGCKNALYLDGFVSRAYLPEKQWTQTDGSFGVMIAVTKTASKK